MKILHQSNGKNKKKCYPHPLSQKVMHQNHFSILLQVQDYESAVNRKPPNDVSKHDIIYFFRIPSMKLTKYENEDLHIAQEFLKSLKK